MKAVSREEIEQVEKELDAVLEMVQRPVTVKNADNREEAASLQENLQESSQEKSQKNLQERSQESEPVHIEIKKVKKRVDRHKVWCYYKSPPRNGAVRKK